MKIIDDIKSMKFSKALGAVTVINCLVHFAIGSSEYIVQYSFYLAALVWAGVASGNFAPIKRGEKCDTSK